MSHRDFCQNTECRCIPFCLTGRCVMTTIIRLNGTISALGSGCYMQGPYTPYGRILGVKMVRSSDVNPAAGVDIQFESAVFDTGGFLPWGFPCGGAWIPQTGLYSIVGYVITTSTTAHTGMLQIMRNSAELRGVRNTFSTASGLMNGLVVAMRSYPLNRGDIIGLHWDSNGTGLVLQTGGEQGCSLSVWRDG
jgi:hypothetical protein